MNWWSRIRLRLRAAFRRERLEEEMEQEMRLHLEMQTEENIVAGMERAEARREAARQFGWSEKIKEDCRDSRGMRWIGEITQDLRYGARMLRKNPGYTAAAVMTMALGIGANVALFSVINGVLLKPLPFPEHERLVTLWESNSARGAEQQPVSPPTFADWQGQSSAFEAMGFWTGPNDFNLVTNEGSEKTRQAYASSELFRALRVSPQLGRAFLAEEDRKEGPKVAVISHRLWLDRFEGSREVLGQSLTVDTFGRRTYTIVGVMPPGFHFPEDTDLWLPAGWNGLPQNRRGGHWMRVLARLKPDVSPERARAEMNLIQARIAQAFPDARPGTEVSIVPLLQQTVGRTARTALFVLWGVVGGVLLIACANVANLTLARAAARQKEMTLRLALGAGRGRIVRQLLTESVLLALLGGAAGALAGYWGLKALVAASPANIPRLAEVSLDGTSLLFTLVIAILTGVICGLAPAWECARADLNEPLKEGARSASAGVASARAHSFLVTAEIALATALLVAAGLMLQSFLKLTRADRGFDPSKLLTVELDFSISGFTTWVRPTATRPQVRLRELLDRVRQLPGVQAVGAANSFLRRQNAPAIQSSFVIFGRPVASEADKSTSNINAISPDYRRALGMKLLRGRDFAEADTLEAPGVAIVNESFVRRHFPNQEPIGQRLSMESRPGPLGSTNVHGIPVWCEIVGVVGDVSSLTLQPEAQPEIYQSYWQWPMQSPTLFVRAMGDLNALGDAIRREAKTVIPNLPPPKMRLMADRVAESTAQPRFQATLLNLFGLAALLLAACGIYGALAYSVAQRRREIGIRMALGAQLGEVVWLIMRRGMKLALAGTALGLLAAYALTRVLRTLLYGVQPTDPLTFAVVPAGLLLVASLACWLPARRAAKVDPMEALRCD